MATTEVAPAGSARPRPWLLIALAVAAGLALVVWVWPTNSAAPTRRASNVPRTAQSPAGTAVDPADLAVRLEALEARQGAAQQGTRNPFQFQPKPPPPAPPRPPVDVGPVPDRPTPGPPPVTGPPPIPMKFIGIVEPKAGDRVAAFSDCRITTYAREGGVVVGQYRLVRIGVESVVMEYLDGRGRTTIRLQGQECVGK